MGFYNTINKKFSLIRVFDNFMCPCEIEFQMHLKALKDEKEFSIILKKLQILVENIFENSLFVSFKSNMVPLFLENDELKMNNNIVMLPGEPTDDIIAAVLYSKIQEICKDVFLIENFTLSSSTFYESSITFEDDPDDYLSLYEYIENIKTPWWKRGDLTTRDYLCEHEDEKPDLEVVKIYFENETDTSSKFNSGEFKGTEVIDLKNPNIKIIE